MWLRGTLPDDLRTIRILVYGYVGTTTDGNSFQGLHDIASTLHTALGTMLSETNMGKRRPLIFIAHALGGLILRKLMMNMSYDDFLDKQILKSILGMLFFGVPNQGMDVESLMTMTEGQANQGLISLLSKRTSDDILKPLSEDLILHSIFERLLNHIVLRNLQEFHSGGL